ncbi:CB070 protein, partial [Alectura lathami]|nr:CB070 protein [Alectura lathami]
SLQCPQPPGWGTLPFPHEVQVHRTPLHTPFNLHNSLELGRFYQLTQKQHDFYLDKTGARYPIPYFVLPEREKEKHPHPLDLPFLFSLENLRTYQTFPSGKRVTAQEREV